MNQKNNLSGRGRDDSDLHDDPPAPSFGGTAGGGMATEIGTRDEERNALGGDPETTRMQKNDKVQPQTRTRSDFEGNR